jgi:hypothetical protein
MYISEEQASNIIRAVEHYGAYLKATNRDDRRLNLALLVDTKYEGMIRRVHLETYDVAYLLDQQWIRRELETVGAMRLQAEGVPDPADGHPAESRGLR